MATFEFRNCEAKAFWVASSNLRKAVREGSDDIDVLAKLLEGHANYGLQPGIRARAEALLWERRRAAKAG
ncbi:MAG: hypothetical protein E5Y65_08750 [Mesorhizobium sp.]|uniref:hypothetical protein n=1 Tax=Mesorhizobium sp. TaxID=1871066 RepID=UPI0012037B0C|nr:hypothetical protein [Mesorhizobium sp.]TIL91714.1 MAG: hypothetical protein E5Y65_08750 [Mesorhizobium sp.]TIM00635.1 MAG: hypothetical protein E5Y64_14045 [Mesorhizobium sp.]